MLHKKEIEASQQLRQYGYSHFGNMPENADDLYKKGEDFFKEKKYRKAIDITHQALRIFEKNRESLEKKAACHSILASCYVALKYDIAAMTKHSELAHLLYKECFGKDHSLTKEAKERLDYIYSLPLSKLRNF